MKGVSASLVIDLLASRHAKDTFVPECKTGPTWSSRGLGRLDAWALLPTWSPQTTIGYEIKVSRSDWLRDTKFDAYLKQCHLFYLVAPKGIVQIGELPESVGFLEVLGSGHGARLHMKRKAVRREIEWPGELMAYVLMSRTTIKAGMYDRPEPSREQRINMWRQRLADDKQAAEIGNHVGRKVRDHIARVQRERDDATYRAMQVETVEAEIKLLGLSSLNSWGLRDKLQRRSVISELGEAIAHAAQTLSKLEAIKAKADETPLPAQEIA